MDKKYSMCLLGSDGGNLPPIMCRPTGVDLASHTLLFAIFNSNVTIKGCDCLHTLARADIILVV